MPDGVTDGLIAALEAGGALVDEGEFSLDEAAARRKLAEHRLADPHIWICLLVEAAIALGSSIIRVTTSRRELEFDFDGEVVEFDQVFGSALGTSRNRASRKIGLALDALLDIGVDEIELVNQRGQRIITATEQPPIDPAVTTARNFIRVRRRGGWPSGWGALELLRSRCAYAPIHIVVDGEDVAFGLEHAFKARVCTSESWAIEQQGRTIGRFAQLEDSFAPARLMILVDGVVAETITLDDTGEFAIVDLPLRKDLSESKILRNAEFEGMLAAVEAARQAQREAVEAARQAQREAIEAARQARIERPVSGVGGPADGERRAPRSAQSTGAPVFLLMLLLGSMGAVVYGLVNDRIDVILIALLGVLMFAFMLIMGSKRAD